MPKPNCEAVSPEKCAQQLKAWSEWKKKSKKNKKKAPDIAQRQGAARG